MSLVVLLRGEPGNGKSFGSIVLKAMDCFDAVLHTDELYVGYIFTRKRDIYRDDLRSQIWAHYNQHATTVENEWHAYLFSIVAADAKKVSRLLVEGWQLTHCFEQLAAHLVREGHAVRHVCATGRRYIGDACPVDIQQLAAWTKSLR
jgi:NADH:ubiquinone oxidoreductase subunit